MRLFIAINFTDELLDKLNDAICNVKDIAERGNFSRRENLHITLAFLGEVEPNDVTLIKKCMDNVAADSFDVSINGFGKFSRNGSDIYWIGIKKSPELSKLHGELNKELAKEGFATETRDFKPHLTIGRQVVCDFGRAEQIINDLGTMKHKVTKMSLMLSERINGKLIYTEIYSKEL